MATFFERITQLYEEARDRDYKVGRKAFAKQLNVSLGKVNGWLNGTGRPDPETLKHIARMKNVTTSWLVGETDQRTLKAQPSAPALPEEAQEEYGYLLEYLAHKYREKTRGKRGGSGIVREK